MNLPQLPADKANHLAYGAAIACVVSLFLGPWWALVAVAALGFLKEISDQWQNRKALVSGEPAPHGVELWDALATIAGGALVVLPQLKGLLK